MDIIYWIIIIVCFVLSFVGLVYPIIPGVLLLWVGYLIYHFLIDSTDLGWLFWIAQILFTLFLFVADFLANKHFLKKYGSSKWGERLGVLAVIVGPFIIPVIGVIIVPFVVVFIVELLHQKPAKTSLKIAYATIISFLSSTLAKAIIQVIMIGFFLLLTLM